MTARTLFTPILLVLFAVTTLAAEDCEPAGTRANSTPGPASVPGQLLNSGDAVADVVEKALPGIVKVITPTGSGTGFIVTRDGLVVTNRHVVGVANHVSIGLNTGKQIRGRVIYRHSNLDLAHIQIEGRQAFTPIPMGDSESVRLGEEVIAIGYPLGNILGKAPTVSVGIISAKRDRLLQTDAALNPGNSGGPLINADGEAVGVVVSRLQTDSSGNAVEGIGFAIPINEVAVAGEQPAPDPAVPSPPATVLEPDVPPALPPTPIPPPEPSWYVTTTTDPVTDARNFVAGIPAIEHSTTVTPEILIQCNKRGKYAGLNGSYVAILWMGRLSAYDVVGAVLRWDDEPAEEEKQWLVDE